MRYLLDTWVLSELVKREPDRHVLRWLAACNAHELFISAMTWGELQRGVSKLPRSKRRSELTRWLEQLKIGFESRILVTRNVRDFAHSGVEAINPWRDG